MKKVDLRLTKSEAGYRIIVIRPLKKMEKQHTFTTDRKQTYRNIVFRLKKMKKMGFTTDLNEAKVGISK